MPGIYLGSFAVVCAWCTWQARAEPGPVARIQSSQGAIRLHHTHQTNISLLILRFLEPVAEEKI
jgi:hypothetical protein